MTAFFLKLRFPPFGFIDSSKEILKKEAYEVHTSDEFRDTKLLKRIKYIYTLKVSK